MTVATRRTLLLGAGGLVLAGPRPAAQAQSTPVPIPPPAPAGSPFSYPYALPPLPYAYDKNEPSIDALTMQIHHDRHHAAYVTNLNAALKDHGELQKQPLPALLARLTDVPEAIRTAVRNSGGGHANHTMYWQVMGGPGGEPGAGVAAAITRDFGSFDKLKTDLNAAATRVFGSGWAFVVVDRAGKLSLLSRPNQDSPLMDGSPVLFGNDVWEHAYYLKYQNRRPDYLAAWWATLNWARIEERYEAAKAGSLAL